MINYQEGDRQKEENKNRTAEFNEIENKYVAGQIDKDKSWFLNRSNEMSTLASLINSQGEREKAEITNIRNDKGKTIRSCNIKEIIGKT